jgi:predicted RNase H-like HicB family nuclease
MFMAECPETGTVSQGSTVEEAVRNLKKATELYPEEFPLTRETRAILTTFEVPQGCYNRNPIITAAKIVRITFKWNCMATKSTSAITEKKDCSTRGEGLNQAERSILTKSTERHDKALRKLSNL